jgi:hypothetical protein
MYAIRMGTSSPWWHAGLLDDPAKVGSKSAFHDPTVDSLRGARRG